MKKSNRFFVGRQAFLELQKRARAKGYKVENMRALKEVDLIQLAENDIEKYFRGERAISDRVRDHLIDKLELSEDFWNRITEVRPDGLDVLLRGLFQELMAQGVASAVSFLPARLEAADIRGFCVPARVVSEEDWQSVGLARREGGSALTESEEEALGRATAGITLNSWLHRVHAKVVIKGEPGEGKTTALWLYLSDLCEQWLQRLPGAASLKAPHPLPVPLILALRNIPEDGEIPGGLAELAIEQTLHISSEQGDALHGIRCWLRDKVAAGQFLLLLDGLDELAAARTAWLRTQLAGSKATRVVLTSRYHADPGQVWRSFHTLRMVPLRWWCVEQFISDYFGDTRLGRQQASELRNTLRSRASLRRLVQNPLLLSICCFLKSDEGAAALPGTRTGLLRVCLGKMLARGDRRCRQQAPRLLRDEQKIAVLSEVSWHFQQTAAWPLTELELHKVLERSRNLITHDPPGSAGELLEEFVEDGVLIRRGEGPYDFLLRRFREYCLARRIAVSGTPGNGGLKALVLGRSAAWCHEPRWTDFRPLNQPGWAEVWPLVGGCVGDDGGLIEALRLEWETREDVGGGRLRLLTETLGEFLVGNHPDSRARQEQRSLAELVAEAVLARVEQEPAISTLPRSWRHTLTHLPAEVVMPLLVRRLATRASTWERAHPCLLAVAEMGTSEARRVLEGIVADGTKGDDLRAVAATGLGLIGDADARDALLRWAETTGRDERLKTLHFGCLSGLAHIGDQASRQQLVAVLKQPSSIEARHQALDACEQLFGPEIEETVLRLLLGMSREARVTSRSSETADLMQQCAGILGRIGGSKSARAMMRLLKLPLPDKAMKRCCEAVANIGDEGSRARLRRLATKPGNNQELVVSAAIALLQVGDERLTPHLMRACSDPACDERVRLMAAEACAERGIGAETFLAERLREDRSVEVQLAAARGLAQTGERSAMAALRERLQLSLDDRVRSECIRGLAVGGDEEAIPVLVQCAENPASDFTERCVAIHTLGGCGGEAARAALRSIFGDPAVMKPIRDRCLDELVRIQQTQGWRALKRGGWDAP